MYRKSRQVTELLGISYWKLVSMLRSGKLPQPQKDASGDLILSSRDVANARKALGIDRRKRPRPRSAIITGPEDGR